MLMAGYGGVLETRGTGTETQIAMCRRAFLPATSAAMVVQASETVLDSEWI